MTTINVTTETNNKLRALLHFAAKKDVRYYLNGILIEVSNGTIRGCATTGHFLAVTTLGQTDAPDGAYILPRELVERMTKTKSAYDLTLSETTITASHGHAGVPIDGKFPDWRRVMVWPSADEAPAVFDAELLHDIAKASKCLGYKHGYYKMSQFGVDGAVFQIADDFFGRVMPLRAKDCIVDRELFRTATGC